MCLNFKWAMCAARGWIPGMWTPEVEFAVAPRNMEIERHRFPQSCVDGPCNSHFAVDNVYFAEVCLFATVCSNVDELFSIGQHEAFRCEFAPFQYHQLASALQRYSNTHRPTHIRPGCQDNADWRNPSGLSCDDYVNRRYCAEGAVVPGQKWSLGEPHGWPERNCCECGK
mmetsp:Transcript_5830/g.17947  ORF Transcript_5830/g.17947 Transcript_5830/m.17947 type:complete len:170 (+) Transcript_5830:848-1357(+)